MTTRVWDFRRPVRASVTSATGDSSAPTSQRASGLKVAGISALVLVPIAGAAEAPTGWLAAGVAAVAVLSTAVISGQRCKWGWLAVLAGALGLGLPRGAWGIIGPPLFVATGMC